MYKVVVDAEPILSPSCTLLCTLQLASHIDSCMNGTPKLAHFNCLLSQQCTVQDFILGVSPCTRCWGLWARGGGGRGRRPRLMETMVVPGCIGIMSLWARVADSMLHLCTAPWALAPGRVAGSVGDALDRLEVAASIVDPTLSRRRSRAVIPS